MQSYRLINNIFFVILCAFFISSKSFSEPTNLHTVRLELQKYHDSGKYSQEISKVASAANSYINSKVKENLKHGANQKLAVVLDVDETSLSYYKNIAKRHFCYDPAAARAEILEANAPAIEPILNLYKNAINHKVSVFFVTARHTYAHKATIQNLNNAGFTNFTGLYTRPTTYRNGTIQDYKTAMRIMIEKQGYTIIASIGDQISDLEGGHAQKTFKLPNPYYYIS